MADQGTRVLDLVVKANTAPTDLVLTVWNAGSNTAQTSLVSVASLTQMQKIADPANSSVTIVTQNQILISNSYLYIATANNHLKRVAILDF